MDKNKLEELKEEKNLKSKEIAFSLGIAESTYSEWERNKIPIPTRRLIQLSNFYEVNIDYILGIVNERKHINKNENIDLIIIGNRLKEIRKKLNLSLRDLGNKLNCSFSSLASYERGKNLIQSDILINLSKISNCSIDWILNRSQIKKLF